MAVSYNTDGTFATDAKVVNEENQVVEKTVLTDSSGAYASVETLPDGSQITIIRDADGVTEVYEGDQSSILLKTISGDPDASLTSSAEITIQKLSQPREIPITTNLDFGEDG